MYARNLLAIKVIRIGAQRVHQLWDRQSAGVFVAESPASAAAETAVDTPPVWGAAGGGGDFFVTRYPHKFHTAFIFASGFSASFSSPAAWASVISGRLIRKSSQVRKDAADIDKAQRSKPAAPKLNGLLLRLSIALSWNACRAASGRPCALLVIRRRYHPAASS
jgi:hypothetical protein